MLLVHIEMLPSFALLVKGAGHKYVKRELTGKPKPKYRYWYRSPLGGLVSSDGLKEGASFRHGAGEERGHYQVKQAHEDGTFSIKHDTTGKEHRVTVDQLKQMLKDGQHDVGESSDLMGERLLGQLEQTAKTGTDKQFKRMLEKLTKFSAGHPEYADKIASAISEHTKTRAGSTNDSTDDTEKESQPTDDAGKSDILSRDEMGTLLEEAVAQGNWSLITKLGDAMSSGEPLSRKQIEEEIGKFAEEKKKQDEEKKKKAEETAKQMEEWKKQEEEENRIWEEKQQQKKQQQQESTKKNLAIYREARAKIEGKTFFPSAKKTRNPIPQNVDRTLVFKTSRLIDSKEHPAIFSAVDSAFQGIVNSGFDNGYKTGYMNSIDKSPHLSPEAKQKTKTYLQVLLACRMVDVAPPTFDEHLTQGGSVHDPNMTSEQRLEYASKYVNAEDVDLIYKGWGFTSTVFAPTEGEATQQDFEDQKLKIAASLEVLKQVGARPRIPEDKLESSISADGKGVTFKIEETSDQYHGYWATHQKELVIVPKSGDSAKAMIHEMWHSTDDLHYGGFGGISGNDQKAISIFEKHDGLDQKDFFDEVRGKIAGLKVLERAKKEEEQSGNVFMAKQHEENKRYYGSYTEMLARFGEQYSAYKLEEGLATGKITPDAYNMVTGMQRYTDMIDNTSGLTMYLSHKDFMALKDKFEKLPSMQERLSYLSKGFKLLTRGRGLKKSFRVVSWKRETSFALLRSSARLR